MLNENVVYKDSYKIIDSIKINYKRVQYRYGQTFRNNHNDQSIASIIF